MLGTLHTMTEDTQPDYTALGKQFSEFKSALSKYLSAQERYYKVKIVLEHTIPTEDGFLEIQKGMIPFDRPNGEMYDLDAATIARESYRARINRLDWLLYRGSNGEDVREDLAERLRRWNRSFREITIYASAMSITTRARLCAYNRSTPTC
jgi:hypothetical protein